MKVFFKKYRPVVLIGIIVVCIAVLVQVFKSTNYVANWLFTFLSDWAMVLSAAVTLTLAIAAFWAITENRRAREQMAEQRRKSIQPSLQIGKLSWFYNHLEIEGTDKNAVAPGIELQLSNVGAGPALDLNIFASAIVEFVSQAKQVTTCLKLCFKLPKHPRDFYLERTAEPAHFRLELTQVREAGLGDIDRLIHIKFDYRDMDYSRLSDLKSIPVTEDKFQFNIERFRETDILPCDDDFPTHLLAD